MYEFKVTVEDKRGNTYEVFEEAETGSDAISKVYRQLHYRKLYDDTVRSVEEV